MIQPSTNVVVWVCQSGAQLHSCQQVLPLYAANLAEVKSYKYTTILVLASFFDALINRL